MSSVRGVICDVDGVVHAGSAVFTEAVEALNAWQAAGIAAVFLTNNASRFPSELAARLRADGVECTADQVVTGAVVGAQTLAEEVPPGTAVLVAGSPALREAAQQAGLTVTEDPTAAGAVLQGYFPGLTAGELHDAARAITGGARWVATNGDLTLPTEWGAAPGNGAYVQAVARATGVAPRITGKPETPAYRTAWKALAARVRESLPAGTSSTGLLPHQVLAIGDRLETDIAGGNAAGLRTVLVTTGVHGRQDVEAARAAGDVERVPEQVVDGFGQIDLTVRGQA